MVEKYINYNQHLKFNQQILNKQPYNIIMNFKSLKNKDNNMFNN